MHTRFIAQYKASTGSAYSIYTASGTGANRTFCSYLRSCSGIRQVLLPELWLGSPQEPEVLNAKQFPLAITWHVAGGSLEPGHRQAYQL